MEAGVLDTDVTLRKATASDLTAVNKIIEAAVMGWDLPERVKRLSLPSYCYQPQDLDALDMVVAENSDHQVVGVAAWEPADQKDVLAGQRALLLHGIYVLPGCQRKGIGQKLLDAAEQAASDQAYDGLLVKAHESATGFFQAQNLKPLKVENENRDYANRYWKPITKR